MSKILEEKGCLLAISPPRPKGPPLNALRVFEAAARLQGFTAAAQELHVTPGAVAQQIKALEDWVGAKLFERHAQGVRLTPLGHSVQSEFTDAFDQLGLAVQSLVGRAKPQSVRIAALPCLAQLWLSPRLPWLRQACPEIKLTVTALEHRPNLMREPYDISLFYVEEPEGTGFVPLEDDRIFPVCAPDVAEKVGSIDDLMDVPLLHDSTWDMDWRLWLEAKGKPELPDKGPVYSLYSMALEEAIHGAGVLIGHEALVRTALADGRLVKPFANEVTLPRRLMIEVNQAQENTALKTVIATLINQDRASSPPPA